MASDAAAGKTLRTAPIRPVVDPTTKPSPTTARDTARVSPARAVERTLATFLASEVAALDSIDPAAGRFARVARDCVLASGKRIRPTFAYWGWRGAVGGREPVESVLPALSALELLHTFALVHDDVMDASATRRGQPTAHRRLAAEHREAGRTGDPDRFGEAGAVLVGDLCLIWADRLLGQAELPTGTLLEARQGYDQMRIETVAGQYLDVLGETDARNWSVQRALRVARHKTASYTVQRPLLFGAALAGLTRDPPLTMAYSRYGLAVGEAFQLCDDLLGAYGDPETTGKPAGDDLRTGKPTVLLMTARQLASPSQRDVLDRRLFSGPASSPSPAEVAEVAEVISSTGAVARVQHMIEERVAEALTALAMAPMDSGARTALTALAEAATNRQS